MKKFIVFIVFIVGAFCYCSAQHYRGFADMGYMFGSGDGFNRFSVRTSHGVYMIPQKFFVGGGIGFDIATEADEYRTFTLPIYANMRYTFANLKVAPFVDIKGGYGVMWNQGRAKNTSMRGGFYFQPSVGISLPLSWRNSCYFAIGYDIQETRKIIDNGMGSYPQYEDKDLNGITLSVGVSF